ncbi:MAG: putative transcriptional regulator [Caulobacteraceae bacterium]|nr:putative transcriptional regulator [Caulobacteraceae bacterium]
MTWAADYRQTWIEGRLTIVGFLNRRDLIDQFKISPPTASADLGRFMRERPNKMIYDKTAKRFVRADGKTNA